MAKLEALTATTTLSSTDLVYAVRDPSGTPLDRGITSANLKTVLSPLTDNNSWSGTNAFTTATASTIAGFDSSKNLITLATATYPSLTELSYVKGVTSAIQTQLNSISTGYVPYTGATTNLALGTNSLTLTGSIASTGSRVTKGWFTDLEVTNMPTVGGTLLTATFLSKANNLSDLANQATAMTNLGAQYKTTVTVGTTNADYLIGNYIDIGDAVNAAYSAFPSTGGRIIMLDGNYTFATNIVFNTLYKKVELWGASTQATKLTFNGTGNGITINTGGVTSSGAGAGQYSNRTLCNFTYLGSDNSAISTQIGIYAGGTNGAAGCDLSNLNITGFGTGIYTGANTYAFTVRDSMIRQCGVHEVYIAVASNSGEQYRFVNVLFADGANNNAADGFYVDNSGVSDLTFVGCSFDDVQFHGTVGSSNITFVGCHFENPGAPTYGSYTFVIYGNDPGTALNFVGGNFYNGSATFPPTTFISSGATTNLSGTAFNSKVGTPVTNAVTLTNSGTLSWSGLTTTSSYTYLYGTTAQSQFGSVGTGGTNFSVSTSGSPTTQQLALTGNFSRTAWTTNGAQLKAFGSTVTDTTSTGTVSDVTMNGFGASTIAASSATTYTNASTVYIGGAPIAGTNATLTNRYGLYVNANSFSTGTTTALNYVATSAATSNAFQSNASTSQSNFAVNGTGAASTTIASVLFAGASAVNWRMLMAGATSSTMATGNSYGGFIVGSMPITTFSSGTHAVLANMVVNALGTVTSGGATVTNTASLYIDAAGSGGTNNYSLMINSGKTRFAPTATFGASFNLPTGTAPTSPVDGDMWREDNTNTGLKIRINGVTKTVTVS